MMLPNLPPASTAHAMATPVPAETPAGAEVGADFAVLLGLQLKAGAAEPAVQSIPDTSALAPQPVPIANPDGNSLPPELPVAAGAETPGLDAQSEIPLLTPVIVLTPPTQGAPPVAGATETPSAPPHRAGAAHQPVTQDIEGQPEQAPTTQPQPRAEQAAPAITLPRPAPAASSDAARSASPASPPLALPSTEGSVAAAPAPPAPQFTLAAAEPSINAPAPIASAPLRTQAPLAFATLVDRLVEARDAARAVQAPQTVSASLTHADFGDIAIRFEHGGQALTVALSNPDPEFVRAVQAAAPAAQTNDSGTALQRHDGSGQQAGGSSGQSPQSQAQAQQRSAGSLVRNAEPHGSRQGEQQPGRSGIFA